MYRFNCTESNETLEAGCSKENVNVVEEYLDDEQTLYVLRVLMFGVTPAISVFGITGNVFSMLVLSRHGLRKSSNILLFSLALCDLSFLIGFNSVPKLLYEVSGKAEGFRYSEGVSYTLYILYHVFHNMDYALGGVSLTLPMLITFERLVAVYLPLKFHQIVTPVRTWCAVGTICAFWCAFFIHMSMYADFSYGFSDRFNQSVGLIIRSTYHYNNINTVAILEVTMSYLMMNIPPSITLVGCIAIGVKVKMASTNRRKMSSSTSSESSRRTTKTLLAVCAVYMVTCFVLSLPTFIPQYVAYTMISDAPSNLGKVMYQMMNIILCINSSYNFIIYVAMNKNFRDTYKSLFVVCCFDERNKRSRLDQKGPDRTR
ncbi:FMRFamide receptor [Biomphalaria glabrata]|uniref:G-protein coupled receptors family 1 profile domain-containing protein n=1 Tax=Biomphalaria glabrata TaxID=6526 RepID=A0A2C9LB10_BIOGL|nr:FMRFamide receptor [Biomphalaria glabrata]